MAIDDPRSRNPQSGETAAELVEAMAPMLATTVAQAVAAAMAQVLPPIMQTLQAGQADAVKAARTPRPESYLGDFPYHEKSHFRRSVDANGIAKPLSTLRCPSYLGYWDDERQRAMPGYEYQADEHGGATEKERAVLNALEPGLYKVKRRDGTEGGVRVELKQDVDGTPMRLVIAVPKDWLSKQHKNTIGGIEFLRQLLPVGHPDRIDRFAEDEAA